MNQPDGKYAIHQAAREGRAAVVESLLNVNPKLSQLRDLDDRLPLHWACANSHLDIIKLLTAQRSFDPDVQDGSGWTPLMIACSLPNSGGEAIFDLLLSKEAEVGLTNSTGATALHLATSKDNLDICRKLIKAKSSARIKDKRGQLALHRAAAVGSVPILKLLLENKSPVNASDLDGMTALHQAISEGHGDVAIELLKAGAETDKRDVDDRLPIECVPDAKVRKYIIHAAEREGVDLE